jgi:AraC-like DNA-binding protein
MPIQPRFHYIGATSMAPDEAMAEHSHDHNEIYLITQGALSDGRFDATEGTVLLYRAGVTHRRRVASSGPAKAVFLWWDDDPADTRDLPTFVRDDRGRIREQFQWMLECRMGREDADLLDALMRTVLHEYRYLAFRPRTDVVARFHAYVSEHLPEAMRLASVAAALGMSPSHLSHSYRRLTGESPMRAVRRIRLEQARQLIAHTDGTLEQVAWRVGFADAYHLSHRFKEHFGHAPGQLWSRQDTDGD